MPQPWCALFQPSLNYASWSEWRTHRSWGRCVESPRTFPDNQRHGCLSEGGVGYLPTGWVKYRCIGQSQTNSEAAQLALGIFDHSQAWLCDTRSEWHMRPGRSLEIISQIGTMWWISGFGVEKKKKDSWSSITQKRILFLPPGTKYASI